MTKRIEKRFREASVILTGVIHILKTLFILDTMFFNVFS